MGITQSKSQENSPSNLFWNKRHGSTHKKVQSGLNSRSFYLPLPAVAGNKGRAIQTPTNEPNTRVGTDHPIPTPPKLYEGGGAGTSSLNSVPLPLSLTFPGLMYGTNRLSQKPQEPRNNDEKGPVGTGDARGCQLQAGGQCEAFWDV